MGIAMTIVPSAAVRIGVNTVLNVVPTDSVTVNALVISNPTVLSETGVNAVGAVLLTDSAALTASESPKVVLPPAFMAVTVYVACAAAAVGVPETTPLVVSNDKPAGKAGLTE
jgi:hypothetical protein